MKRDRDISEYVIYSSHISKIEDSYSIFSGLFSFRWESNWFFLQAMNFIISFYPSSFKLVYLSYHYFHVECFNRNRLGDCRGLTIGWWTYSLMLRSVASPYTTFYKWAQMAGSWRQWANFSVAARKKNQQKKKKSQNTILTKSNINGRLEPICNFITILLHE